MILNLLLTIQSISIPLILGFAITSYLFRKNPLDLFTNLALSWGLGMGILTHWMLILLIFRIKFDFISIYLPLFSLTLFFLYLNFTDSRRKFKMISNNTSSFAQNGIDWIKVGISIYIGYYLIYIFWRAITVPIYTWDELEATVLKSKLLFLERALDGLKYLPHPSYPLHIELAFTWVVLNLTSWDEQLPKIIFPITLIAYLRIQYFFLRYFANKRWSLFGLLLLMSSNLLIIHSTIAYRDLTLLYYTCSAIFFLLLWRINKESSFLIISSVFAGIATFTKLEGLAYLFVYLSLIVLILFQDKTYQIKDKIVLLLKFFMPSFGIAFFYIAYKFLAHVNMQEKTQFDFTSGCINRLFLTITEFIDTLFLSYNWNIVWLILLFSLFNVERIKKIIEIRVLFSALFLFFALYFLQSVLTTNFFWISGEKSYTTTPRLILHFFPLATVLIVLLNGTSVKNLSK